jgi:hypothetical protein
MIVLMMSSIVLDHAFVAKFEIEDELDSGP